MGHRIFAQLDPDDREHGVLPRVSIFPRLVASSRSTSCGICFYNKLVLGEKLDLRPLPWPFRVATLGLPIYLWPDGVATGLIVAGCVM